MKPGATGESAVVSLAIGKDAGTVPYNKFGECVGFAPRAVAANGETHLEIVSRNEPTCEVVYRKLVSGSEADPERGVALRAHPLEMEFHMRSKAVGFQVQGDVSKAAVQSTVGSLCEGQRAGGGQPMTV